jgi:hypothetical protein
LRSAFFGSLGEKAADLLSDFYGAAFGAFHFFGVVLPDSHDEYELFTATLTAILVSWHDELSSPLL